VVVTRRRPRVRNSPTSGPNTATRTSRGSGSSTATSAGSTGPVKTGGCSATGIPAPTYCGSAGPRSSDTDWCQAVRHPTTRPWPPTGPDGDEAPRHHSTGSASACFMRSTGDARPAVVCCSPPTRNPAPPNGNSGPWPSARPSARTRSRPTRRLVDRTIPPRSASYTPGAGHPTPGPTLLPACDSFGSACARCGESRAPGAEGAPAQQCAGATRHEQLIVRAGRRASRRHRSAFP